MRINTSLASSLSLLNIHVQSLVIFLYTVYLFLILAIDMTTILLPVIFTCRTQTKHICISYSAFLSSYLDSSQRSLKNVILCSSLLRLARPLLVSSSRCLVFYEPCHEPAPFYTKGGPSRRSHSEASRRFRGYSDWDGGGLKRGVAYEVALP